MPEKDFRRVTLTLAMDTPLHRQTWKILSDIQKGRRTEYICKKIIGQQDKYELADIVYENTLKALNQYGGSIQQPVQTTNIKEAEEIEQNLLGFLASLE